jgi:branched-chain amino acid transport system permease protein
MPAIPQPVKAQYGRLPRRVQDLMWPTLFLALLLFYPSYIDFLPSSLWVPTLATGTVSLIFVMMALGLNVVVGYAGLLDLGYVAFYAAGAYVAGWFASQQFATHNVHFLPISTVGPNVPGIHVSIWILLLVAGCFSALLGVLIGLPTLRLRGDYLAIVTLGFGEIIPQMVRNGDDFFGTGFNLTNGPNGLTPIDSIGFGQLGHSVTGGVLPVDVSIASNSDSVYYWIAFGLVALTLFCCIRLRDSRLGRAWIAIREDEIAAAAMGVPLMKTKTAAYAIGAFIGGVAGCYYASYKASTFPGDFFLNISIFILCMVILGGMGNVWGVMVGALILAWLNYQGLGAIGHQVNSWFGTSLDIPKYEFGIFGIVIVSMMLLRPQGLIASRRRSAEFEHGVEGGTLYDASA